MEYHELNSTFEYGGKVLKVVEDTKGCTGCYFHSHKTGCAGPSTSKLDTRCTPAYRYDSKGIIYQEVKKISLFKHLKRYFKSK